MFHTVPASLQNVSAFSALHFSVDMCCAWFGGVVCFSICVQCSFQISACTVSGINLFSSDIVNRGNGSGLIFTV